MQGQACSNVVMARQASTLLWDERALNCSLMARLMQWLVIS